MLCFEFCLENNSRRFLMLEKNVNKAKLTFNGINFNIALNDTFNNFFFQVNSAKDADGQWSQGLISAVSCLIDTHLIFYCNFAL